MSAQFSSSGSDSPQKPDVQFVSRPEFIKRHIAAIHATFKGAPPFNHAILPRPEGADLALDVGGGRPILMCRTNLRFDFTEARGYVCDADAALAVIVGLMDRLAQSLWVQLADGNELEPRDTVFLERWTAVRVGPQRMTLEEAERLFGDTPQIDLKGDGPPIDWEGPTRLVGDDPEFQGRKEAAQLMFDHLTMDALEQFTAATFVAFMQAGLNRKDEQNH